MLLLFYDILSRSLLFFLVTLNVNFVWSPDILFDLGNFDPLSGEYMQSGVVCGGSWGIQKNLFPSLSFSRWFPHCEVSFFLETSLHFELGGIQKNFSLTYFFQVNINRHIVLLDRCPIIVYPCRVTDWLTHSCLEELTDVTLACEDARRSHQSILKIC